MANSLNKLVQLLLAFSLFFSIPFISFAQDNGENPKQLMGEESDVLNKQSSKTKKKKEKNVKLDFSEEMVEGNSDKPYELMLMKRPDQKFKKILKFRDDFQGDMESSFDDVR